MFDFVSCATDDPVLFNIESKINPVDKNRTRAPEDFVEAMGAIFTAGGPELVDRITHQSFDVGSAHTPAAPALTAVEIHHPV